MTRPPAAKTTRVRRLASLTIVIALLAGHAVAETAELPSDPIVALAYDARADLLLKSDGKAVYESGDEGRTWQAIPFPVPADGKIASVAVAAGDKPVLYVAGPGLGVRRTDNDGAQWSAISDGLPNADVTALAAHATQPDTIYAYLPDKGIYRSQDAGKNWRLMDRGPEGIGQLIHSNMEGSMESGWLYAATKAGVQLSMDCFCFWRDAGELTGPTSAIAFDSQEPKVVYAATESGFFRSNNGGQTWERGSSPGPIVKAIAVVKPGIVLAATADGQMHRSTDRAGTWEPVGW